MLRPQALMLTNTVSVFPCTPPWSVYIHQLSLVLYLNCKLFGVGTLILFCICGATSTMGSWDYDCEVSIIDNKEDLVVKALDSI